MEINDVRGATSECSLLKSKAILCYSCEVLSFCIFVNSQTSRARFPGGLQFGFDLC